MVELKKPSRSNVEGAVLLNAIIENAIDGIIIIDAGGFIDSINPPAYKLYQYTPAEVTGKNISILMPARKKKYRKAHKSL